ncbi:hemolysin family protein [Arthrobacter sp. CG_A4]|uniref:hemolysin family protein n=1 Tax=Arthrobacter sp. CG_A4 TaxID=3071706 RepID=UPI002DF93207|nr:putative hemolysin [Arthrobacter sp. CG_A4]
MDIYTLINLGLVLLFVLTGGVFAAMEMALVSLRESQLHRLKHQGRRGAKVATLSRDPNKFLAAVQIGVTVAGFLSAAYGASTLAPDVVPLLETFGVPRGASNTVALVGMTLLIAYLSLVFGELVPKRFALQKAASFSLALAPPLVIFAGLMRPVIWLLSVSTNTVVKLLGGDPHAKNERMSDEELRDLVGAHQGLEVEERQILSGVLAAADRSVTEVMRHRGNVVFLTGKQLVSDAIAEIHAMPYSRYPVIGRSVDDVIGFVHVRDLFDPDSRATVTTVADIARSIVFLPGSNRILPAMTQLRRSGVHIAVVIDEYGGTDGIVTLEDLVEEFVGEIRDEYDPTEAEEGTLNSGTERTVNGSLNLEDFSRATGIDLLDGPYETVAGFVIDRLGRMPVVGDKVPVGAYQLSVAAIEGLRITRIDVISTGVAPQ